MQYVIPFLLLTLLLWLFYRHKKSYLARRIAFIENYTFPKRLHTTLLKKYPHLAPKDTDLIIKALREYFIIATIANGRMVSMPSQAVDEAWHEFLLFTREYQKFCHKAFGRYFHHHPAEAMKSQTVAQTGIKRTWKIACARENISPDSPHRLPLLFAIDSRLEIPDGFYYQLNCTSHPVSKTGKSEGYCASHIGCSGIATDGTTHDSVSSCIGGGCSGGCGGGSCGGGCDGS